MALAIAKTHARAEGVAYPFWGTPWACEGSQCGAVCYPKGHPRWRIWAVISVSNADGIETLGFAIRRGTL